MASKFKAKILDLFRAAKPAVATGGNGEPPAPVTEQSIIGGSNIVERNGQTYVVPRGGPRSLGSVDLTALDIHDENKPAVSRAPIQQPPHNIFEIDGEELFVGHGRVADERVASAAEIKRLIAAAEEQEIQKLQRIMERFEKTQSIPVEEMDALGKTLPIVPAAEIAALKIPADQNGAPANLPALKPTVLKIDPEKDAVILDANRFENVFFLSSKNSPAELVLYPDDINDGLAENLDQEIFVDAFNEVAAGDSSLNLEEATERERHDNIMEVALRRPRAPETRDIIIAQAEEMMLLSPEPGRHKGYNVGRGLALLTTLSAGDAVYATRQIPPLLKFISSPEPELASEAVKRNSAILLDKIMTYESHLQSLAEAKYAQDLTDKERQAKIVAATVRSMEKIAAMRAREEEEARKISDIKLTADRLFAFVSKGGLAHAVVDLRDLTDLRKVLFTQIDPESKAIVEAEPKLVIRQLERLHKSFPDFENLLLKRTIECRSFLTEYQTMVVYDLLERIKKTLNQAPNPSPAPLAKKAPVSLKTYFKSALAKSRAPKPTLRPADKIMLRERAWKEDIRAPIKVSLKDPEDTFGVINEKRKAAIELQRAKDQVIVRLALKGIRDEATVKMEQAILVAELKKQKKEITVQNSTAGNSAPLPHAAAARNSGWLGQLKFWQRVKLGDTPSLTA